MDARQQGQSSVRRSLFENRSALFAEIPAVFAIPLSMIAIALPWIGDNPLRFQGVVWVANMVTIGVIWLTQRLRGQGWRGLGLGIAPLDGRAIAGALWRSVLVFVAATAAFVVGAIVMAIIAGRPEGADLSGYNYLSGNLPMLLLALAGVFLASSLGEEILYRGFLITRLEALGGGGRAATGSAIVISSIVFGLGHFAWGPTGMVQTGFMGLVLALAFVTLKRRLWILVLAHFYMDATLLIQMFLTPVQ